MPAPATYFTILTAISQLPPLSLALWAPGKAAQINFFTNDICTQYVGEVAAWWTMASLIGWPGPMAAQAECISLNMPSNSQSTATVDHNDLASLREWVLHILGRVELFRQRGVVELQPGTGIMPACEERERGSVAER
ncbi:hypothetical protein B0H11DRAFT_2240218 [Mycena galericulata]|nr:hypothetical protein B0H11DRAFT_2240218 [Mycena galericulata]